MPTTRFLAPAVDCATEKDIIGASLLVASDGLSFLRGRKTATTRIHSNRITDGVPG